MKIHLTLDGRAVPATLADTEAARAFAAMLPLAITLYGLFGREKFGPLPGAMPLAPQRLQGYEVGDIICWSAGPDLAILHAQDGQALAGGFHVLGRIDTGAEAFGGRGPLDVRIELAEGKEGEDGEAAAALPGRCAAYRGTKPSTCVANAS
ncbi:cyclophilin-like fold protein [Variovorax ginsengisoli]|uniref:Cyclophilin-like domain-containing protein n=1 Tax=Variovorax ginsengisoli TaxID=363844 RepID=A0ABT9S5P6_9BURK|nr:cyclophilin-like fold protein [Variovorax ginsengisoli]MDP9899071.1 hypothetical protein [Variovorax ginsengisoli]